MMYVLLTLCKPLPSAKAQYCVEKSWMQFDGKTVEASTAQLPAGRQWWHGTEIGNLFPIIKDSLQTGPQGNFKGVYSFAGQSDSRVYGGHVYFAFRSCAMPARCSSTSHRHRCQALWLN